MNMDRKNIGLQNPCYKQQNNKTKTKTKKKKQNKQIEKNKNQKKNQTNRNKKKNKQTNKQTNKTQNKQTSYAIYNRHVIIYLYCLDNLKYNSSISALKSRNQNNITTKYMKIRLCVAVTYCSYKSHN